MNTFFEGAISRQPTADSRQPIAPAGGGCPRPLPPLVGAVLVNGDGGGRGDWGADS
jgi:hypothetical protein